MAVNSLFGTTQKFGGAFSANYSQVGFAGMTSGHLAQSVNFQYQQQVTMLYELGSNFVYYVGGRAQGTASISKLVGPKGLSVVSLFQSLCDPQDISIEQKSGCQASTNLANRTQVAGDGAGVAMSGTKYGLQGAVLTAVSGQQTAQEVVFTETLQFMFLNLLQETVEIARNQTAVAAEISTFPVAGV